MTEKQQQVPISDLPKLTAPKLERVYGRTRLFERIDQARQDSRLVWIGAEAGSGKTTLAVSYMQERKLGYLWYQFDEGDADTASFFYYMDQAARVLDSYNHPLPMLTPEYLGAIETYARNFFRELFSLFRGAPGALILDNYQDLPDDAPLHQLLAVACEELPPELTIVVLSRKTLQAAYARLFANGQTTAIATTELRLTLDETRDLSALYAGKEIDKERAASLYRQTGGWTAGLMLILNQSQTGSSEMLMKDTQPPDIIFDYFAAEIFQRLDDVTQDFMLRSALLPTMSIDAVCGLTGNTRAAKIMNDLVRQNYFTVRHAGKVPVYEYHDLFRQFLIHRGGEHFSTGECRKLAQAAAEILIHSGQYEHAAQLLITNSDHNFLQALIEQHAPALVAQGRLVTLENWLQAMPADRVEVQPWLRYWLAYCRMPRDIFEASRLFENAYFQFKQEGQPMGQYLAWAGIVEVTLFGLDEFSGVDRWVDELHELQNAYPLQQFPDIAPRVVRAALTMLIFVRSDHPEVKRLVLHAESMLPRLRGSSLYIIIATTLQLYYAWVGDLTILKETGRELQQSYVNAADLEPLARLSICMALAITGLVTDDLASVREWGARGLEYGEQHGIMIFQAQLFSQITYAYQLENDLKGVEQCLEQLWRCTPPESRMDVAHCHYQTVWLDLEQGELAQAREHAERALIMSETLQASLPTAFSRIKLAEVLAVYGEYEAVPQLLDEAEAFAQRMGSQRLLYMAGMTRAFALLRAKNNDECATVLAATLRIGRDQGYTAYYNFQNRYMAELCSFALEHAIENDYVRTLIRKRDLLPPPGAPAPEAWPWPVQIYTLGRFEIVLDGEQLQFTSRVPQKPLELLQVLLAMGGAMSVPQRSGMYCGRTPTEMRRGIV